MKFVLLPTVFAAAIAALPLAAGADPSSLINRAIVQQALQAQMQNQLNTQAVQLQAQQDLTRAAVQSELHRQSLQLQYLELQQQLNLTKLQVRQASSKSHKTHRRSH